MPSITETVIRAQFPLWQMALRREITPLTAGLIVVTGCGSSYYLAQVLACAFNTLGQPAIAVPGAEWARRPEAYCADFSDILVIGLSRSGTTTETVQAIGSSRAKGWATFAISCEDGSAILKAADHGLYLATDPREGIVMTTSASLMLLGSLRLAGTPLPAIVIAAAERGLAQMDAGATAVLKGRSHFVYLGAGVNYGLACEGALKLQEMSLSHAQAFHPLEYRHGPISLIDSTSLVVMLYSDDSAEEAKVAADVQSKDAIVIGINGPGDLVIDLGVRGAAAALAALPALQIMGEHVALMKGINSETPRHLTKVVVLN